MKYSDVKIPKSILKMNKINGIIITVTNYTYNPGIRTISKTMTQREYNDFMVFVSAEFVSNLVNAIDRQRYNQKWPPLSIKYYRWKKVHKLSLHIWEATGCMKRSIKLIKKSNFIGVGFSQRDVYPSKTSRVLVNDIARYLEYGTGGQHPIPARPLFRPITIFMRKHVSDAYKRYKKELKKLNKQYIYF